MNIDHEIISACDNGGIFKTNVIIDLTYYATRTLSIMSGVEIEFNQTCNTCNQIYFDNNGVMFKCGVKTNYI